VQNITSRREYFTYKGVKYGIGTKVLLSDVGCKRHYVSEKNKDKPHTFGFGYNNGLNVFNWIDTRGRKYGWSGATIYDSKVDEEIKAIVEPVYVELIPWQQKAVENMFDDEVYADIFGGVLIYIIVMIVGALFVERWLIWIFATVAFIIWILNQYRT
jgi:hypothetical protein